MNGEAITINGNNYVLPAGLTGDRGSDSLNDTGFFGHVGGQDPADAGNGQSSALGSWGAGGGGAGTAGEDTQDTPTNDSAGNGGAGKVYDITGTATYYAGGGGGGVRPSNGEFQASDSRMIFVGAGGQGGGGAGSGGPGGSPSAHGENGVDGTGGGGGGVGSVSAPGGGSSQPADSKQGGKGGSGVVIIRYHMDTDGDGFTDNDENDAGSDPLNASSIPYETVAMNDGSTVKIFKYDARSDNGQGQTEYTIDFPANVVADVLIVGGGGSGGAYERSASYGTIASTGDLIPGSNAGGGGAGGVIVLERQALNSGTYTIRVGDGGESVNLNAVNSQTYGIGNNGKNSSISYGNITIEGIGGGGGGNRIEAGDDGVLGTGRDGGSGGGTGSWHDRPANMAVGNGIVSNLTLFDGTVIENYRQGHDGGVFVVGGWQEYFSATGGGGAGGAGQSINHSEVGSISNHAQGGNGGIGRDVSHLFTTAVGDQGFVGGGGGGTSKYGPTPADTAVHGNGGQGGGGDAGTITGGNGMAHTGGGGGGANYNQTESSSVAISSGTGGSGVVVIRYSIDTDADGISDDNEATLGSDPSNPDTDGDGEPDGYEVAMGTDPTDANSTVIPDLSTVVDAQIGAASGLDSIEGNLAYGWMPATSIINKMPALTMAMRLLSGRI